MNVTELFRRLSYGELSNLAIGSEGDGSIVEAKRPTIISHANEGLLRLYSRFVLRENSLILQLFDYVTNYHLICRFAQSNPDPNPGDPLYIVDHVDDPYANDLIKIMSVTNAIGEDFPLNDHEQSCSVFTPQPNTLQVPFPIDGQIIGVVYQAKHEQLSYNDMDACINLPAVLEGALTAFIAYRVFFNMNGQDNSAKASEHLAIYESVCSEVIDRDLVNSSQSTTSSKFHTRGFA